MKNAGQEIKDEDLAAYMKQSSLKRQIDGLHAQYREIEGRLRTSSPDYAAVVHPHALTTEEIQEQVLDQDTLLLEYGLGEQHSYLWAVTRHSIQSFELPKQEEIERLGRQLYNLLTQ